MNYNKDFNNDLIKRFASTNEFGNKDIDKLRKGVYPYEHIHSWKKLIKHCCLIKKIFIAALTWKKLQILIICSK